MWRFRYLLLPIIGAIAAILAFRLAMPFEGTLSRTDLAAGDPRALYTYGTRWGDVNRVAFGALIGGPFCFVLTYGRRTGSRVIISSLLGLILGGLVNFCTDSSSDVIGMMVGPKSPELGQIIAALCWCILVPMGFSLTIAFAMGMTSIRLRRARFATLVAGMSSFGVQIIGSLLAGEGGEGAMALQSQLPVWRTMEIATGIALGLTMAIADEVSRVGTVRLVHGHNEFKDWSLDYPTTRIGTGESCEIPLRGFQGVEPVHALLIRQANAFILEAKAPVLVNGQPVGQVALNHGDGITVGTAKLVFTVRRASGRYPVQQVPVPYPVAQVQVPGVPLAHFNDMFGQELRLPPGGYGVGRDQTNAICLPKDTSVSRRHAEIIVTDTGVRLVDLGSRNGTKINGAKVTGNVQLNLGDVLEFGDAKFTYFRYP